MAPAAKVPRRDLESAGIDMIFQSKGERLSNMQLAVCSAVLAATSVIVMSLLELSWRYKPLCAATWAIIYFGGAFRWLPRSTPVRKAFTTGVFIGTALTTIEWIGRLLHIP